MEDWKTSKNNCHLIVAEWMTIPPCVYFMHLSSDFRGLRQRHASKLHNCASSGPSDDRFTAKEAGRKLGILFTVLCEISFGIYGVLSGIRSCAQTSLRNCRQRCISTTKISSFKLSITCFLLAGAQLRTVFWCGNLFIGPIMSSSSSGNMSLEYTSDHWKGGS